MFPYTEQLSDYTASFPAAIFDPSPVRNYDADGVLVVENGFVPLDPGPGTRLRLNLDRVPIEQAGMRVLVDGDPRTIVPYGEVPATGQVAVSMRSGVIEFAEADADLPVQVSYRGRGTPIMAFLFHQLGAELKAVQTRVKSQVLNGPIHIDPSVDLAGIPGSGRAILLKYGQDASVLFFSQPFQLIFECDPGTMRPRLVPAMNDSTALNTAADIRCSLLEASQVGVSGATPSTIDGGTLGKAPISNRTANYTITQAESGRVFTSGTGSTVRTFTLPAWQAGLRYRFIRTHNNNLVINAVGSDYMATRNGFEPLAQFALSQSFQCVEITAIQRFEWDFGIYFSWVIHQFN